MRQDDDLKEVDLLAVDLNRRAAAFQGRVRVLVDDPAPPGPADASRLCKRVADPEFSLTVFLAKLGGNREQRRVSHKTCTANRRSPLDPLRSLALERPHLHADFVEVPEDKVDRDRQDL